MSIFDQETQLLTENHPRALHAPIRILRKGKTVADLSSIWVFHRINRVKRSVCPAALPRL